MSELVGGGRINFKTFTIAFYLSQTHMVPLHICKYGTSLINHHYHGNNC